MSRPRPPVRSPRVFKVRLDPTQAEQLRRHATRRGLDVDTMFNLLVKTILNDKLIDAVIDDNGDAPGLAQSATS